MKRQFGAKQRRPAWYFTAGVLACNAHIAFAVADVIATAMNGGGPRYRRTTPGRDECHAHVLTESRCIDAAFLVAALRAMQRLSRT